jgi:hypothetical protein
VGTAEKTGTGDWVIAARSRLQQQIGGAELSYPGRLATCPRGHVRVLPTRFSRREFMLRCDECGRSYSFREPT